MNTDFMASPEGCCRKTNAPAAAAAAAATAAAATAAAAACKRRYNQSWVIIVVCGRGEGLLPRAPQWASCCLPLSGGREFSRKTAQNSLVENLGQEELENNNVAMIVKSGNETLQSYMPKNTSYIMKNSSRERDGPGSDEDGHPTPERISPTNQKTA